MLSHMAPLGRNIERAIAACAVIAAALTATMTVSAANRAATPRSLLAGPGGITLIAGGVFGSRTTPQLTAAADKIFEGTVTGVGPSQWNSPDGKLPPGETASTLPRDGYLIYTPVTV